MKALHLPGSDRSMAALAGYIAQSKLSWVQQSLGGDDTMIWEYETAAYQVADCFFPPDYIEFLRVMGLQTPILFTDDASMNLLHVQERYQYLYQDGDRLPPNLLLLTAHGYNFQGAVLECFAVGETDSRSGHVFYNYDSIQLAYLLAESLTQFLWQYAFEHCACLSSPHQRFFSVNRHEPSLLKVSALMESMGWQQHWFSDIIHLCASDSEGETALCVYESQNLRLEPFLWVRLGGQNSRQVARLSKQITQVVRARV